jgi:TetR/AcrR family transcriptional repressor of nem operon
LSSLIFIDQGVILLRLTKEQTEQNRRKILDTASRLFRLRGIESVSVADVMKESGFTHGGFYNHFNSKEELAAEAVSCAFEEVARYLSANIGTGGDSPKNFLSVLARYVSPLHRDADDGGCPASALPLDAAHSGNDVQKAFAEGIEKYLGIFAAQMTGNKNQSRQQAIVTLTGIVGACVLSRAVREGQPELSDELLHVARKHYGP